MCAISAPIVEPNGLAKLITAKTGFPKHSYHNQQPVQPKLTPAGDSVDTSHARLKQSEVLNRMFRMSYQWKKLQKMAQIMCKLSTDNWMGLVQVSMW